jgi:DNA-binding NtrC family response regulator
MESYPWPGNVDELRDVIERSATRAVDGVIRAVSLPFSSASPLAEGTGLPGERGSLPLEAVERDHIRAVLEDVGWHQGRAAEILGISPKTLYRKIRQFGFQRPVTGQREAP